MEVVATCPGCDELVTHGFHGAKFVSEVRWERLADGRYVGTVSVDWPTVAAREDVIGNVIHECRFRGGGEAGDRSSIHPSPSPRATSAKADPTAN
jgi:hypothetical protein